MLGFIKSIFSSHKKIDHETAQAAKEYYKGMIETVSDKIKTNENVQIEKLIQWMIEKMVMIRVAIDDDESENTLSYLTGQLATLHLVYQVLMKAHGNKDKEYLSDNAITNFDQLVKSCDTFTEIAFLAEHMWVRTLLKFQKERKAGNIQSKCSHEDC